MFNEKEVVTRILKGDMRAFELLVKQYERLVFHVTSRIIKDEDDIADICQEVFIKIHKGLFRFNFQSKLSTWVAQVTYFTAINYLKKYKNKQVDSYPDDIENYHFTNDNPEQLLTKKEVANYVEQLILQLPETYRTVITLYHLNEFSLEEIGEITGMPEGTIKSYLFRARKLLKEKVEVYLKKDMV
ncbi:RNA polymerase sigma-70 factor, ECF subfamily [Mucilaginibacter mallensis]|uniref:RNA polymerase sigma-70 factor, ECF subfamily n=1 Tax=Mucilaginibacter mallensis TaxID=652787 RepID=A0A1H1W7U8_MUCMA|nr:sigma-70 family RNA polymerase sigma factor [Mucilaginibacter mallensis]SDS93173.1 RNA polymerase sigma-70 factor, ECF subfamily [Mucilaginibacter mallensis]